MKPSKQSPSVSWVVTFGMLGLVVACGGRSAVSSAAGGSSGSVGTGGSSGVGGSTGTAGGSSSGPCPNMPPVNGSACTVPYKSTGMALCSYGDDPRPQCRTRAVCNAGAWQVSLTPCAAPPLPAACPTPAPSATSACSDATLSCWYGDGTRCWCSACNFGTEYPICQPIDPPQWYCASPATDCPVVMPQAGTPCSTPGASCGPDCTLTITCTDGVWQWGGGMCPICAAPDTPIATPDGEQPIASLRVGDLVYSEDHDAIVVVPLLKVEHTSVKRHRVMRVTLDDGRVLEISPGHPTADGRKFGDLFAGTKLDAEHLVRSVELVPYTYDATFDILPASSTGTYYAAGALIGSTLFRR
jgi:hypothetical protein